MKIKLNKMIESLSYNGDIYFKSKLFMIQKPYTYVDVITNYTNTPPLAIANNIFAHMDESIFTSHLEVNLNNLISDQFSHWKAQFKQFLSFTERTRRKPITEKLFLIFTYFVFIVFLSCERVGGKEGKGS